MNMLNTIPRFACPYTFGDYAAALAATLKRHPPAPEGFQDLLGDRPMFWASSGRQALWLILRALALPRGAGVGVPLYTDRSIIDAVRWAGYEPVFLDVEESTLTLDPASVARSRSRLSALIVVHFFGHVARIPELTAIAGDIPIVEDTCHAPLSYYGSELTGTFGAASFYSFASTKYWPAGGGGLAVLNDSRLAPRVMDAILRLKPSSRLEEARNATLQMFKGIAFSRLCYGFLAGRVRASAEPRRILEPELDDHWILRHQAAGALRQARRFARRLHRQRSNSHLLLDRLHDAEDVVLPIERPGVRYSYHLFPVLLRDIRERDAVARAMLDRGVDTSRIYFDMMPGVRDAGYRGGCPVSESVVDRMLTLPNYGALDEADIDRVAAVFLDVLRQYRAASRGMRAADRAAIREEVHQCQEANR